MSYSNLLIVLLTGLAVLVLPSVCQNSCGTDQNPYCAGNSVFEQLCCPYPNVCYWQNRDGTPGCCPAGTVCDGTSPYYPSTPTPGSTTTIHPSTVTLTPTLAPTTTAGVIIIVSTITNGPSVVSASSQPGVITITSTVGGCGGGVCSTVTSFVGGVYSTVTSGAGGAFSTVTSVVGGGFSTVTSGAASVYSSISGVLVGAPSAAPSSTVVSIVTLILATTIGVVWNVFG